MPAEHYRDLGRLLKGNSRKAKEMLLLLKEVSKEVIALIEKDMMEKYGFTWKVCCVTRLLNSYPRIIIRFGQDFIHSPV
jgi:hypothetical protein